jgi:hypothetical protein
MRRAHITAIAAVLLIAATAFSANVTVQVEEVHTQPGQSAFVRVLFTSDITLSAIRIPLIIEATPSITLDSVSYVQSVATPNFYLYTSPYDDTLPSYHVINILPKAIDPVPTISQLSGELCRIYVSVRKGAAVGYSPIDTFYIIHGTPATYYDRLDVSDYLGRTIVAQFQKGGIWIDAATAVDVTDGSLPVGYALSQNFPNPFNPSTQISLSLPKTTDLKLEVFNILGARIATIARGKFSAGEHQIEWNAADEPSGIYLYRLSTENGVLTRKMSLIK